MCRKYPKNKINTRRSQGRKKCQEIHVEEIKKFINIKKNKYFNISDIKKHLDETKASWAISKPTIRRIMKNDLRFSYK